MRVTNEQRLQVALLKIEKAKREIRQAEKIINYIQSMLKEEIVQPERSEAVSERYTEGTACQIKKPSEKYITSDDMVCEE